MDALLKLGVLNADRLTEDDVKGIALLLHRVKVADDVHVVESMIAGGGANLPQMCVNDNARMLGVDGRVLAVLDVHHLSNGATLAVGTVGETGTCTHIDICSKRLPTVAPGYNGTDQAVTLNASGVCGGDRVIIRIDGSQPTGACGYR